MGLAGTEDEITPSKEGIKTHLITEYARSLASDFEAT